LSEITKEPRSIEVVAHHEAAHAVVCFVLYGEQVIKGVEVHSAEGVRGHTSTYSRLPIPIVCRPPVGAPRRGNPAPVSADAIVDAHGVLCYAGMVAECIVDGREPDPAVADSEGIGLDEGQGAWLDREALSKLASTVGCARPAEHFFREYWEEARRLLRIHWNAVESLAAALVEHGALNGDRVDAILEDACNHC
jgi:hypothetical protein